jgi:ribonuclease P protein component
MRKEARLRKGSDYARVRRQGRGWSGPLLTLRALANETEFSRFGFLVSRRVGKAVVRNRVKRRLREIARRTPVAKGWDLVFIARPAAAGATFQAIEAAAKHLLKRGRLYEPGPRRDTT